MANLKLEYAASSDLTITLASLASSSTLLAGSESDVVDNSSNKYLDYLLSGEITVGTTPTTNTKIEVWAYAGANDTPLYPDVFDGTGSAETVTNAEVKRSGLRLAAVVDVVATTSDVHYPIAPISIASLYGGVMPKKWGVFVTHNTGVNLNSTAGNHKLSITPLYATSA